MVKVVTKLKNRNKPYIQHVRTVAEAKKIRRFVGKAGKVTITARKRKKPSKYSYWFG